jgi:SAM-dependent methyltransferase
VSAPAAEHRVATVSRAGGFWTERKVRWYRRALARSDYAAAVLGALEPALAGCRSVLDVGAGCGALAVPLAERLERVTALEPAPAMAEALRRTASIRGLDHLAVVEAAWGEVPLDRHDLVVCAHVGELTRAGAPFLREAPALARRAVALVRDAGREPDKFFFGELYPRLLGRPYGGGHDHAETLAALAGLGITPAVRLVAYRSDQPFRDLDEACDFWEEYLGVGGREVRAFLWQFLARRLTPEPHGWVAPYPKQAAVIWWTTEGA